MSDRSEGRKYNNVRYWRFIFAPIIILILILGLYLLFTMPEEYSSNYSSIVDFTDRFIQGPLNATTTNVRTSLSK